MRSPVLTALGLMLVVCLSVQGYQQSRAGSGPASQHARYPQDVYPRNNYQRAGYPPAGYGFQDVKQHGPYQQHYQQTRYQTTQQGRYQQNSHKQYVQPQDVHHHQQEHVRHQKANHQHGEPKIADKDFLQKQQAVLKLLVRIQQYNQYTDLAALGKNYDILASGDRYTNAQAYYNFVSFYKQGLLPRGQIFNVYNDVYLDQAIALFDLFYFAKDYETFLYTAAWARDYYNEGQFAYAFYVAVIHRPELNGIVLPPLYEVYPYFYFYGNDIQQFAQAKQQGQYEYTLYTNFSGFNFGNYYGNYYGNPEQLVSYFTEDIGLNAYYAYSHLYNPFWFSAEKYGFSQPARGHFFYYYYQQIINYYQLNRIANSLPELEEFNFDKPIPYGYYPGLQYHNGHYFPARADNYNLQNIRSYTIQDIQTIEQRIRDAIDSGFVYNKDGSRIPITNYLKGINILGNIVESNGDSVNQRYYGSYQSMLRSLFALIMDPDYNHGVPPGVLANYETSLRDPAFYYFYSYITRFFRQYASYQPAYKSEELYFNGVTVNNVEVDKLYTFFDYFKVDVSNAIYTTNYEEGQKLNYYARSLRLNHEPFNYKVYINSNKNTSALVRVFFGPSANAIYSNEYGFSYNGYEDYYLGYPHQQQQNQHHHHQQERHQEGEGYQYNYVNFNKLKEYFVEWDRFPVHLGTGDNVITRSSDQFTTTVPDLPSFHELSEQVEKALEGQGNFYIQDQDPHCGLPNRLLLPLGRPNGTPYSFFVVVTPYTESQQSYAGDYSSTYSCSGYQYYNDNQPLGYPFDREIYDFNQFYTPNMYFKDVNVYQKVQQQVNEA